MSADREGAAERNPLTPPARIPPRRILRHRASGPNPNEPGLQARPDEPERAAVRRLAYLRSEPGADGRTLHEPAVPWLPKEPAPASLEDVAPDRNTARPEGERKRARPFGLPGAERTRSGRRDESPRAVTRASGAALDVFEQEPPPEGHPLFALPNVILSPHSAGLSKEAAIRMAVSTARNVIAGIDGKLDPSMVVNREVL
jgi:D-isomer specific 2-hydroxyacid dehydrogenase, NAD binding domain